MLMRMDHDNEYNSLYMCDKCKGIYSKKLINSIFVKNMAHERPLKQFDLCINCYRDVLVDVKRNLNNFERDYIEQCDDKNEYMQHVPFID